MKKTYRDLLVWQKAMVSLFEIQTQLELSKKLEFLSKSHFSALYESSREIERMLSCLINKTRNN